AIRRGAQPVIMINGNRVDLPAGLDVDLEEGDQISVISPLGGG
ncbi:MAG: MoaD/ThiS family protein, partial [Clostridia bacterium]|nr:MoaD/ThiS family protein [Clostridia bacterium]